MICFIFIGHGGSDGLHGYVPSLDHVVVDTVCIFILSSVNEYRNVAYVLVCDILIMEKRFRCQYFSYHFKHWDGTWK